MAYLKVRITSLNGEQLELSLEDGRKIAVPISTVEGQFKVGQEAVLAVFPVGGEEAGREQLARDLLNGILKG